VNFQCFQIIFERPDFNSFFGQPFFVQTGAPHGGRNGGSRQGKTQHGEIEAFFTRPSEIVAKFTAPPSGLFLEKVCYAGDKLPEDLVAVIRVELNQN